jgi:Flp pilus assembly secretin CpaC
MERSFLPRLSLAFLASAALASAAAAQLLRIPAGTERTIGTGTVNEANASPSDVVLASPAPMGGLTLRALAPGKAEVTWRRADGAVRSEQVLVLPELSGDALSVYSLVGQIPGIEVYDASGKIVIDGKVSSAAEKDRVAAVVAAYGNNVLNLSVLDTGKSNDAIADFIRRSSGVDSLSVTILGDTAYLRGTVPSELVRSNAVALASTQIAKVVDMTEVRQDMIETEVLFLRVQKNKGHNFGMNLLDGGDGLGLQGNFNGAQNYADHHWGSLQMGVGWTATLAPKIQAIVSDGDAEVVARPRVGTCIGEKGRFLSGGEMYYKTAGEVSGDLQSVEYGIELSVAPRYLSGDRLCNDIVIELSFPNQQSSSADLSLDKYTIESSVVCELGQSVVLSGLTERIKNAAADKTPILGDIPLVNLFFSSRTKDLKESELVAVITPRLLDGGLNERRRSETTEGIESQRKWLEEHDAETLRVSLRAHAAAREAAEADAAAREKAAKEAAEKEKTRAKAVEEAERAAAKIAEKERQRAAKEAARKAEAEEKAARKAEKEAAEAAKAAKQAADAAADAAAAAVEATWKTVVAAVAEPPDAVAVAAFPAGEGK